ncbi:hypothetical protein Taro_055302 [Colocasia esculenta]|uniref:Uncharacterized protein n=1 Tax=Colocasia esculenta TaxID=4460 RepID=A0A843XT19_COLES|nr:hypothetical protein [Colocasia esculenta]
MASSAAVTALLVLLAVSGCLLSVAGEASLWGFSALSGSASGVAVSAGRKAGPARKMPRFSSATRRRRMGDRGTPRPPSPTKNPSQYILH